MTLKEQIFFFKRLAFLSNANIPLAECLQVLLSQARSKKQRAIFAAILADVSAGQSLSAALGKFPKVFSAFCVSLVKVGESSGTLPSTLEYLAAELKKKQMLRAKVVGAFIYPAVITAATLGITVFLILFLFPKIMPIFKSLRATLPFSTRIVMGASKFLEHDGLWLLLAVVLAVIGIATLLRRSHASRLIFHTAILRMPLIGGMMQSYVLSNSCRTLGLLLTSGTMLPGAVLITADATPNLVYKREFEAMNAAILRGGQVSTHLSTAEKIFPPMLCNMVAGGERSGTLSQTLLYVAELYDNEVDEITKHLSTLIEPALMVCMGLIIGFIAVSIITPIYAITQNLHV